MGDKDETALTLLHLRTVRNGLTELIASICTGEFKKNNSVDMIVIEFVKALLSSLESEISFLN